MTSILGPAWQNHNSPDYGSGLRVFTEERGRESYCERGKASQRRAALLAAKSVVFGLPIHGSPWYLRLDVND